MSADKSRRIPGFGQKSEPQGNALIIVLLLAVVFLSLGISLYTFMQWRNFRHSVESTVDAQINNSKNYLGTNIKGFEERISSLEKIMEPFSLLKPEATLQQVMEKASSDVEARNEERFRKVQEKIDSMTEEVIKAREKVESSNKKELVFISLIKLRAKLDSGQPFAQELALLQASAGKDNITQDNINILKTKAEKGVPSIIDLRDGFSRLAGGLIREEKQEEVKEMPFYKRFVQNLYKGVSIRKVRNIEGDSPEAMVARIEDYLKKGNLASALQEVEKLHIENNSELNAWLENAKSYNEADAAFNNILGHIVDEDAERVLKENQPKESN